MNSFSQNPVICDVLHAYMVGRICAAICSDLAPIFETQYLAVLLYAGLIGDREKCVDSSYRPDFHQQCQQPQPQSQPPLLLNEAPGMLELATRTNLSTLGHGTSRTSRWASGSLPESGKSAEKESGTRCVGRHACFQHVVLSSPFGTDTLEPYVHTILPRLFSMLDHKSSVRASRAFV